MSRVNCERPCEINTLAAKLEGSYGFLTKDSPLIKDIETGSCEDCATEEYVDIAIADALQLTLKIDDIKLSDGYIAYYEQPTK